MNSATLRNVLALPEAFISRAPSGKRTFFDTREFPWVANVEATASAIRRELARLVLSGVYIPNFQDIQPEQRELTDDEGWKTFFLYAYGRRVDKNCRRCPITARVVETIPGMRTAMFSILGPYKVLPSHRGPYSGVLRYHLGVKIPRAAERCGVRVGDEARHWAEGKSLIFDDSHLHAAWNWTEETRVILFVDFLRPLPWPLSWLNRLVVWAIGRTSFLNDFFARIEAVP